MTFTCNVCGNNDYEETDGLYYCTLCSTQSQEMIMQEVETVFHEGASFFKHEIKTKKKKTFQKRNDYGRPWTIYEGYQVIIMAQAEALINLGQSKDLKDIVFSVWANYLAKLGVAFCKSEKVVPDIVVTTSCGRQRELHRGNLANPLNRNKRSFESVKREKRKRKLELEETLSGEEEVETTAPPTPRDKDNVLFVNEHKGNRTLHSKALKSPEWMNLRKTISITYLGLQMSNPQIIPADIIRWIYEGKIPFLSTTHLLPPDMVMSGKDALLFAPVAIDTDQLICSVNQMRTFLKLGSVPVANITLLVTRFLSEMELPDKLLAVCMELRSKTTFHYSTHCTKYRKPEMPSLLYIGLSLKLLFGCDGVTERKISSYSLKVRSMLKSDSNIFVFDEWRAHLIRKSRSQFDAVDEVKQSVLTAPFTCNPDKLVECYNNLQRDEVQFVWQEGYIAREKQQNFRQILRHPLSLVLTKQEREAESINARNKELAINMAENRFKDSCLTHIADFSSFKKSFHSRLDETEWKILKKEVKGINRNLAYTEYKPETDKMTLYASRPRIYMWLLETLARIAGCSVVALDQGMIKMQGQLKNNVFSDIKM